MKDFKVFASCHNHSTYSDGEYTPDTLARIAKNLGHGGIILTDHDTVQGYPFMKEACDKYGLKTMMGAEFTTYHTMPDGRRRGIHLLGFDFDPEHEALRDFIPYAAGMQTDRSKILFRFAKESGEMREGVEWEDVLADHPNHNYFCNNEVFASFMKRGIYRYDEYDDFVKRFFSYRDAEREQRVHEITKKSYNDIETADVIKRIKAAGGVPVIAHPQGYEKYADELLSIGAMGFETRHSMINEEAREFFTNYCNEHKLYKMGGADHENVLGGLLVFGDECSSPYETSGIDEECFMEIFERKLG
ncbi:MAG: PHP domain-containing protein [Clostridia bacterium]|nr:PHP domain-containing protein [Clostridia bacterium]